MKFQTVLKGVLALSVTGCMASSEETLSSAVQEGQVTICHYDGQGRVKQITISEDAAAAHEDHHGDHGLLPFYADGDGDGFGAGDAIHACAAPAGTSTNNTDCNDGDAAINPAAAEVCGDGIDNNCDGASLDPDTYYADGDGDGYGAGAPLLACTQLPNTSTNSDDCNDGDAAVNPAAAEVCGDNTDNNCDGALAQAQAVFMFATSGGQQFNAPQGVCTTHVNVTVQVCRETPTQQVKISSTADGSGNAYYDELATVTVTGTSGTTGRNYRWWEANCIDPVYPTSAMGTAPAQLDITSLFGASYGVFDVNVRVVNAFQPHEWFNTYVVPVN